MQLIQKDESNYEYLIKYPNIQSVLIDPFVIKLDIFSINLYISLNRLQLNRIYPKGTRIESSNYDPVTFWVLGYQLVALWESSHYLFSFSFSLSSYKTKNFTLTLFDSLLKELSNMWHADVVSNQIKWKE